LQCLNAVHGTSFLSDQGPRLHELSRSGVPPLTHKLICERKRLAPSARADVAFDNFARFRRFEEGAGGTHADAFGLSWYSASCFDIFSRAFAGAVVARTKLAMPATMLQTSLRGPTLIKRLVMVFSQFSVRFPLDPATRVFCTRSNRATPPVMFRCYSLGR
jgi:hypothetical protein